jgi:glycosyltransferase involved in cell wall biosynthesis
MRLLVLTHEYPPVGGGGARVALDICEKLVEQGDEVKVLTMQWGDLPLVEKQRGVFIHRLKCNRQQPYRASFSEMARFTWIVFWIGLREIRRWKPDLIHVHFAVPGGAAAWALSTLTGIPYVLTAHLGDVPGGVPEKTGRWFRWIFPFTPPIWRRACGVAAVSAFTRHLAVRQYPVAVEVIPNGVNLTEFDPGVIQLQNPPHLVFAGRFVAQKNPLFVVRTLAKLKNLPWECTMLGDGALHPQVEREIDHLGLKGRVSLPGWVTSAEVLGLFQRSDILFMPSLSEGLPVVGVQALAMGLALVLSNIGGCIDLVEPGRNGFLVKTDDETGFEEALRILLVDKERLLAFRFASRLLAKRFDLNTVVESYRQLFSRCSRNAEH